MKELDLYEGVSRAPGAADHPAGEPRPLARGTAGEDDWIKAVWQSFPPAIRERYRPHSVLGEGGLGIVLEAHDRQMDRPVAIKGVRDPRRLDAAGRERLAREARLHARLAHPNILPIFDSWFDAQGNSWCSMLVVPASSDGDGGSAVPTLHRRLRALEGRQNLEERPVAELLDVLAQICRGVSHAHERGIIHRDLKPENVLLGPAGEALVADWGLACERGGAAGGGEVVGSPRYASPEQLGSREQPFADERSDVYSLGAILYEMVAGAQFAPGQLSIPARVPRELASVIRRATAPAREERFPDARALLRALEAYQQGDLIDGLAYSPAERAHKWMRAHPRASVGLVLSAVFSALLALGYVRSAAAIDSRYRQAQANLATSHAGWAALFGGVGRSDEALAHAALAFQEAAHARPGWSLPEGPVWTLFARRAPPSALIWACRVGRSCKGLGFTRDGSRLHAATEAGWHEFEVPHTARYRVSPFQEMAQWNIVLDPLRRQVAISDRKQRMVVRAFGREQPVLELTSGVSQARPAFSPDGRLLATGSGRDVSVWELPSGRKQATLVGHPVDVWLVAIDARGERLASSDREGGVRLWDLRSGRQLCAIKTESGQPVLAMQFSPDGASLALAGAEGSLHLVDTASGRTAATLGRDLTVQLALAFSPDGKLLAAGGHDFAVRIWDLSTRTQRAVLAGHTRWILSMDFSPDSRILASGAMDGSVRLWDVQKALESDTKAQFKDHPLTLAYSPDGHRVALNTFAGAVQVWETSSCRLLATTAVPDAHAVGWTAGARVQVAILSDRQVRLVRPFDGGSPLVLDAGAATVRAALEPRGRALAVARADRGVRLFPLEGGAAPRDLEGPAADVTALEFSEDGQRLAAGDARGGLVLWELPAARRAQLESPHRQAVNTLRFGGGGRALVTGDGDGVIGHAEAPGWKVDPIARHMAPVLTVALNHRGDLLASAAGEAIHLWRAPGGARVPHLEMTTDYATAAAFSPDDTVLALGLALTPALWDLRAVEYPDDRIREIAEQSYFAVDEEANLLLPKRPDRVPEPRWPPK